jgi:SAM-dependent methyltransferase
MIAYGWEQYAAAPSFAKRLVHRLFGTYDLGARVRYRAVQRALSRIAPPRSILDAGSGRGQLCFAMHRRWPNAQIVGVDYEFDLVEYSRNLMERVSPKAAMRFERRTLPDDLDERFDLITSVDVLEHIVDDRAFLASLCAATNSGGSLVLHTPAAPQKRYLAEFEEQHDHVRDGYAAEELAALLREAGYADVSVRHTFGALGAIAWEGFALARLGNSAAKLLLPLWYVLSELDTQAKPRRGNGLLAVARKP